MLIKRNLQTNEAVRDYQLDKVNLCKDMFMNTLGYEAVKFRTIALASNVLKT